MAKLQTPKPKKVTRERLKAVSDSIKEVAIGNSITGRDYLSAGRVANVNGQAPGNPYTKLGTRMTKAADKQKATVAKYDALVKKPVAKKKK